MFDTHARSLAVLALLGSLVTSRLAHATEPGSPSASSAGFVVAPAPAPPPAPPAEALAPITVAPASIDPSLSYPSAHEDRAAFNGGRFALEWLAGTGGVLASGLVGSTLLIAGSQSVCSSGSSGSSGPIVPICVPAVGPVAAFGVVFAFASTPFSSSGFATLTGRALGGRGGFGWSLLGAAAGVAVPSVLFAAGIASNSGELAAVGGISFFVLPGLGAALGYELSSAATVGAPHVARASRSRRPRAYPEPAFGLSPLVQMRPALGQLRADTLGLSLTGSF